MIRTIDKSLGAQGANDIGGNVGITVQRRVEIQIIVMAQLTRTFKEIRT